MKRIVGTILTLTLFATVLASMNGARAAAPPAGSTWSESWFPSGDGTLLHADIFRPANIPAAKKTPVLMLISPYLNTGGGVPPVPETSGPVVAYGDFLDKEHVFQRGYSWIQVSLRGFGASDGCNDFGGKGEQADVKAAVEWGAKRSSTGKVGLFGISYDGWTQVMALATHPRGLGAAVIMAPLLSAYMGLYMNGVHYAQGWNATMADYQALDAMPPSPTSDVEQWKHVPTSTNPACYATNISSAVNADPTNAYWTERDLIPRASHSTVPVLWTQGFIDANVKPSNLLPVYSTLRGPHRAWFGQWVHQVPTAPVGRDGFYGEAMEWFDRYVKGARTHMTSGVTVQAGDGRWRSEEQWPPADATPFAFPLKQGSYVDVPGNFGSGGRPQLRGIGSWTFTKPFPYDAHIAGVTHIDVDVSTDAADAAGANLVGLLYDIHADRTAWLMARGALRLNGNGHAAFDLYPQDWTVARGERLGLLLSGADESWFNSHPGGLTIKFSGSFAPSFLRAKPDHFIDGFPGSVDSLQPQMTLTAATITASTQSSGFPPRMR